MKYFKQLAAAGAFVILGAAMAAPAHAQRGGRSTARSSSERTEIDTTFAFSNTGRLDLSILAGDIRVTGWARNEVRVIVYADADAISASFAPARVRLEQRLRNRTNTRVRLEINVPMGVRVSASALGGNIDVSGTKGEVNLNTAGGSISAADITDRSEIETMSGHVTVQRAAGSTSVNATAGTVAISDVTGDLDVEVVSAGVKIERAELSAFGFDAMTGSLDFSGTLAASGRHKVETVAGRVTLRFPATFAATLELESFRGAVQSPEFPLTLVPSGGGRDSDRQMFTLNGGGARVSIETVSGVVSVRKIGSPDRR